MHNDVPGRPVVDLHNPLIYAFALSRAEEHLGFLRESLEQRDNIMAVRRRNATSKEKIPLPISHQRDDTNVMSANFLEFRVGIQWRAHNLLFDFQTYPNYQKVTKFINKSTIAAQNLRA